MLLTVAEIAYLGPVGPIVSFSSAWYKSKIDSRLKALQQAA